MDVTKLTTTEYLQCVAVQFLRDLTGILASTSDVVLARTTADSELQERLVLNSSVLEQLTSALLGEKVQLCPNPNEVEEKQYTVSIDLDGVFSIRTDQERKDDPYVLVTFKPTTCYKVFLSSVWKNMVEQAENNDSFGYPLFVDTNYIIVPISDLEAVLFSKREVAEGFWFPTED
jgi:hypothetical protein